MTRKITDMVGKGREVYFVRYKEGAFIYRTECGFEFPVYLTDIGTSELRAQENAMMYMKYIKRQLGLTHEATSESSEG